MNTMLIIDDDEIVVLLIKHLFQKKYFVYTANDGAEALDHLSKGLVPDLIISDLMMKNITGAEFIKQLYNNKLYEKIPVIIISGTVMPELKKEFPAVKFIDKPFDPVFLKTLVDEVQLSKN